MMFIVSLCSVTKPIECYIGDPFSLHAQAAASFHFILEPAICRHIFMNDIIIFNRCLHVCDYISDIARSRFHQGRTLLEQPDCTMYFIRIYSSGVPHYTTAAHL